MPELETAWIAWLLLTMAIALSIAHWIRRTGEIIAPFPLVLATIGFYFLPRAAYLLWFDRAPLSSAGLLPADQLQLISTTLILGFLAVAAFVVGHSTHSSPRMAAGLPFSVPDPAFHRAVWIAGGLGFVGLVALAYVINSVGGIAYALEHQYQLSTLLQGKLMIVEVTRLLMVPTVLLLIDPVRKESRWWVWIIAAAAALALYPLGRRSFFALAIGYPVALYHLTVKRIPLRWLLPATVAAGGLLFSLGYVRLMRGDRLDRALTVFYRQPLMAVHFANASGELKIFDAATMVVRDVPRDMNYSYGSTLARVPWMIVPRRVWTTKPATLGNILVSRNLPHIHTGYPPTAVGELYAAAGFLGVLVGFLGLGWVTRVGWEWRKRNAGVGNATAYLMFCFFAFDVTRVGDPSRTVWFLLLGLGFFTAAFCFAAKPRPAPTP